jgi:hypothetical protein
MKFINDPDYHVEVIDKCNALTANRRTVNSLSAFICLHTVGGRTLKHCQHNISKVVDFFKKES